MTGSLAFWDSRSRHFEATRFLATGMPVRTVSGRGHANETQRSTFNTSSDKPDRYATWKLEVLLKKWSQPQAAREPVRDEGPII